jgi:sugar lactone lactonase YvrE
LIAGRAYAQLQEYNHPELKWRTIETEHFYIHFHQDEDRTASLIAKIAEEIFKPITELYEYQPDGKIHFIVRDHDDNANGAAFYYDNKVEIWAPPADFLLRGDHNWLRNVVTHEFSHMVSLGAARKGSRKIPAFYFQWLTYEDEKRPDVIHGYPNKLISFPFAMTVIPMWFAEGMAQFQRSGLDFDTWDTHRDMLLRTAIMKNKQLSLIEMGIFGKNSLGNERTYNQGYGLTLYIAYRYGEKILNDLVRAMKSPWAVDFSTSVKKVLGKSDKALYEEWIAWLKQNYQQVINSMENEFFEGKIIENTGIGNFYSSWSPDGSRIVYISNRGYDYMSQTSLWLTDSLFQDKKMLENKVLSSVSWSPDGKFIIYGKKDHNSNKSNFYDLYIYNLEEKKEKQITRSSRARHPDWSENGKNIVCIIENDGTSNLVLLDREGKRFRQITNFKNGEQITKPHWMKNSREIVFALMSETKKRNIAIIDSNGSEFRFLIKNEFDTRDPFPGPHGEWLYYSCDKTGIFNIYKRNIETKEDIQLTNVLGGAFMPCINKKNKLVYSLFTAEGYKLALIDTLEDVSFQNNYYKSPYKLFFEHVKDHEWDIAEYNDRDVPEYKSQPYKSIYSKLTFLPRVMVDYPGKIKIGTYFYGGDFLDKFSIFGGAAVNTLFDTDIFCIINYKRLYPTLFLEAFQQTRHTDIDEIDAFYKIRFNLLEADIGAEWRLDDSNILRTAFIYSQYKNSGSIEDKYQGVFGKFSSTYHVGKDLQIKWTHNSIVPSLISEITPVYGRTITFEGRKIWNSFLDGFEVNQDYGTLIEVYKHYNYYQLLLDWREYVPSLFKNHSLALRFRAGWIDRRVDSFYHFYGGGIDGIKGYPYYSLEGLKLMHFGLAYRFPIFRKMGLRFLFFNLDNLFLSFYGDIGNAWNDDHVDFSNWKRDIGIQMRLGLFTFYNYPMKFFIDSAYGFDRFKNRNRKYGGEWRLYLGFLFDFLD